MRRSLAHGACEIMNVDGRMWDLDGWIKVILLSVENNIIPRNEGNEYQLLVLSTAVKIKWHSNIK